MSGKRRLRRKDHFESATRADPPDKGENRLGSQIESMPHTNRMKTNPKKRQKQLMLMKMPKINEGIKERDSWGIADLLEDLTEMYSDLGIFRKDQKLRTSY